MKKLIITSAFCLAAWLASAQELIPFMGWYVGGEVKVYAGRYDGKWGLKDANDKVFVLPKYDRIYKSSQGIAVVRLQGRWGYLDMVTGDEIIPLKYSYAGSFSGGKAKVNKGGKVDAKTETKVTGGEWTYIDKQGKELAPFAPAPQKKVIVGQMGFYH